MTPDSPAILTSREHRACHARWERFREDFPMNVRLIKMLYSVAERSTQAFGPHIKDVFWIDPRLLHEDMYGGMEPVDILLEALFFPPASELVNRTNVINRVKDMILEHAQYGSDGLYMPRSVVLGWVLIQHDNLLSDIEEAA